MNWYMVFLKVDPNHTDKVVQRLRSLHKNPTPDVTLHYAYNVFGTWDVCLWFQAKTQDNAMAFVQRYIRSISHVTETNIIPTTTINEYKQENRA